MFARHALVRLTVLTKSAVLRRLVRRLGLLGVLSHLVRGLRHGVFRLRAGGRRRAVTEEGRPRRSEEVMNGAGAIGREREHIPLSCKQRTAAKGAVRASPEFRSEGRAGQSGAGESVRQLSCRARIRRNESSATRRTIVDCFVGCFGCKSVKQREGRRAEGRVPSQSGPKR